MLFYKRLTKKEFSSLRKSTILFFIIIHFVSYKLSASESLQFIQNKNQWDKQVLFKTQNANYDIYIKNHSLVFNTYSSEDIHHIEEALDSNKLALFNSIRAHAYSLSLENASTSNDIVVENKCSNYVNYFVGKDPSKWAKEAPIYEKIIQQNVYPNIDWVLYSADNHLKYDFVVKPHAKCSDIRLIYSGAEGLSIENGNLKINTSLGEVIEEHPIAYQIIDNKKINIDCAFKLEGNQVSFSIDNYNHHYELIIDPSIIMGTYSGGRDQVLAGCSTFDTLQNMYSAGTAINGLYPVTLGAYRTTYAGIGDVIISKYNAIGTAQIFATYIGGYGRDMVSSIVIDPLNRIIIGGYTYAPDYPVTPGCIDPIYSGDTINRDAYLSILNNTGSSLLNSTFIGGSADDEINDIKLDASNNIYICGSTTSFDFPVTSGVFDPTYNGSYDAFVCKINTTLSTIITSTFLGSNFSETAYGLNLDAFNNIYVLGKTYSLTFPTTSTAVGRTYRGAGDGFVSRFDNSMNLLASTLISSIYVDYTKFAIHDSGLVYILGYTESAYGPYPSCKASTGFGGVFLTCYKENLDSLVYKVPLTNFDVTTNITAFELSDSNYLLISTFLNLIRSTFPDSVYLTDTSRRSVSNLYILAISKNAEEIYYASLINNYFAGHIHGTSCRFNKKNNRLFHVICSRATERGSTSAPYRNCLTAGEYDMFSLIYQPTISTTTNYLPKLVVNDSFYCSRGYVYFGNQSIGVNSFKWILPNGQRDSINRNINFTRFSDGMNIVKLIVKRNCSTTDTLVDTFFIPSKPSSLAIRISDSSGCISNPIILTGVQLSGNRNYWRLPSGIIDSTHDTIIYYATTTGLQTFYLISDSIQCPYRKDTVKVVYYISNATHASIIDIDTPQCLPYRDTLRHNSTFYNRFVWSDDLGNVDSIHNGFYLNIDSVLDYNIYLTTYGDVCNSRETDTFRMRTVMPPHSTIVVSQLSACPNSAIGFYNNSIHYQSFVWTFNDSIIDSISNNISVFFTDSGVFNIKLISKSIYCSVIDTAIIRIRIHPKPIAVIDTVNTYGCVPFTSTLSNHSFFSNHFYWLINDSLVDSNSINLPVVLNRSGNYIYKLIVFGDSCNSNSDTTTMLIHAIDPALVQINIGDSSACRPFYISLLNNSFSTDRIEWLVEDTLNSTNDTIDLSYLQAGNYNVQLVSWNLVCPLVKDTEQIQFRIFDDPVANASLSTVVGCPPLEVQIENNSTYTDSIYWNISDSFKTSEDSFAHIFVTPGTYQITAYAYNKTCSTWDTAVYTIQVLQVPIAAINCSDTALCIPDTATLVNGSLYYNHFEWTNPNFDNINNTIFLTATDSAFIPVELIVYGNECPMLSDTVIQYIFFNNQIYNHLQLSDTSGCQPLIIEASLSMVNTINRWTTIPSSSLYINKDTQNFVFSSSGLHTIHVEVYDPNCLETPLVLEQEVITYPQSRSLFYYSPIYLHEDSFTYLISLATQSDSILWIIDDSIRIQNIDSVYLDSLVKGTHLICLQTQNIFNCNDTFCQSIYVLKKPEIPSPCTVEPVSAFTPNGDGNNDRFYILFKSMEAVSVQVYNRWGEIVYEIKGQDEMSLNDNYWDGTFKNRALPMGNYTYIITGVCKLDHQRVMKTGNVTLIR